VGVKFGGLAGKRKGRGGTEIGRNITKTPDLQIKKGRTGKKLVKKKDVLGKIKLVKGGY